jgi:hypothetical protein
MGLLIFINEDQQAHPGLNSFLFFSFSFFFRGFFFLALAAPVLG